MILEVKIMKVTSAMIRSWNGGSMPRRPGWYTFVDRAGEARYHNGPFNSYWEACGSAAMEIDP